MDILNAFHRLPAITYFGIRRDDNFADRLNYKYTVGLLVFFSIVIAGKQFSNDQIQWYVPKKTFFIIEKKTFFYLVGYRLYSLEITKFTYRIIVGYTM
jgi:hypothetical protein